MKKSIIIFLFLAITISIFKYTYFNVAYPLKYISYIKTNAEICNLPPELIASVINVESSYCANAKSRMNAIGLMQLLPSTAKYICELNNINYDMQKLYEPNYNIQLGSLYIKYLKTKFDNTKTALCAYNAGETNVKNWLKTKQYSNNGSTLFCVPFAETRQYVDRIERNLKIYKSKF